MLAVLRTGGKQYQVKAGTIFDVEKLSGEIGDSIQLKDILLLSDGEKTTIGRPCLKNACVTVQILEQKKAKKVFSFKKLRRKGKQVTKGHRQRLTRLKVTEINS